MSEPYHLVVFDWEGTIGDTLGLYLNSLLQESQRLHLGAVNEQAARQFLVFGLVPAIKKLFPNLKQTQQAELLNAIQQSFSARAADAYVLPGALDIVKKMKAAGIDLAIATNKGQQSLQRDLQGSGFDKYFSVTRTASQAQAKPHPQMLSEIIEQVGVSPRQVLMIGDSVSDIEMARLLSVDAIGVDFYSQPEHRTALLKAGAIAVFDDYRQLACYLRL